MVDWLYCPQCENAIDEYVTCCSNCKRPVDQLEIIRMDQETLEFMTEATDSRRPPRSDSG